MPAKNRGRAERLRNRYLDLLESALIGTLYDDPSIAPWTDGSYQWDVRAMGEDWPRAAHTMIGLYRMRNLRQQCERVIAEDVPGDFLEAGVWRGGACIYMRAILEAYRDPRRRVFVADSFQGLPPPDPGAYPADAGDAHHTMQQLAVPRAAVEENFRRYGLLDQRVVFLEGWFKDTLPMAPVERLAVLRLDGDMYESTIQIFDSLYHKVSRGGAVIVDDFNSHAACARATHDFRARHGITAPIVPIDHYGVWWQVDHDPIPPPA
jgi:O-methyltransferase